VSNETDRDRTTDALLRARLRARDAGGDGHLDAETLAAWADGAIYGADATGIEAHLADCARCQAMMASFATSEPAGAPAAARVPAAVVPFRPRPIMKWLPLVGTAAAAVLIWAVWPHPTPEPPPITMADASRPAEAREVPPLPSAPTAPAAQTARAAEPKSKTEVAGRTADTAGQVGQANAPARQVAGSQAAAAAPPPPPPPAQKPPVPTPSVATGAAAADRNAAAELRAAPAREPEVVVAEFGVIPPTAADIALLSGGGRAGFGGAGGGGRGGRGGGGGGGGGAAMSVTMARSVDVRWRVLSDGSVQRSTEGSGDWTRVALDPPAHVLSGVAPTATVCWLVGREGAVLLSVDGRTFTKVAFPETADLQSVVAIDARRALVTTSDGRRFLTSDGGATWRLQDSPARPF
jgi:hypothetical protein